MERFEPITDRLRRALTTLSCGQSRNKRLRAVGKLRQRLLGKPGGEKIGDGFLRVHGSDNHIRVHNSQHQCDGKTYYDRDMRELAQRLVWAREKAELSQAGLAKLVKISQSNIGNLESGARKSSRKIVEIAKALGVSPDWLANGTGNPGEKAQITARESDPVPPGYVRLRMLDATPFMGSAGTPIDFPEVIQYVDLLRDYLIVELGSNPESLDLLPARGDSMSGTIEHGDIVFVDRTVRCFEGDGVYVIVWQDGLMIKRLQGRAHGGIRIKSDNKNYDPIDIEQAETSDLTVCGRVTGSWTVRRI
ncbi:helix-turn-helix transcriptional regulator [Robbsia sp. Bb-Pol-6]|uniref:Helix-turn-helix transcriptional regulator n=1 Tax=Robbsia betulipollinis TaxID=2981849 RepID=A0ABT3ZST1_9BURK|nr:helix-turn-helix transcriptional regulator [Robbsia betulipollinis]